MERRRGLVLGMLMEGKTEVEIAKMLEISQPSVSRDLGRLAGDSEKLARDLARLDLASNTVWKVFQQLDAAVDQTLKTFDGTFQADPQNYLAELHLLLDLLGRKCYLLKFCEINGILAELYLKSLEQQFVELGIRLGGLGGTIQCAATNDG